MNADYPDVTPTVLPSTIARPTTTNSDGSFEFMPTTTPFEPQPSDATAGSSSNSSSSNNNGAMIGGIVGGVLGFLLISTVVLWLILRHRRQSRPAATTVVEHVQPISEAKVPVEPEFGPMVVHAIPKDVPISPTVPSLLYVRVISRTLRSLGRLTLRYPTESQ